MSDIYYPRQPMPVTVTLSGETEDIRIWMRDLRRRAESAGDQTQILFENRLSSAFVIYPRAVND